MSSKKILCSALFSGLSNFSDLCFLSKTTAANAEVELKLMGGVGSSLSPT